MKSGIVLLALFGALPAFAADDVMHCTFETLCTGTTACEPAEDGAAIDVRRRGEAVEVTLKGETEILQQAEGATGNPETYFGAEPGDGGGMMLSLFADNTAVVTLHGDLFGPFVATAFGTCAEAEH